MKDERQHEMETVTCIETLPLESKRKFYCFNQAPLMPNRMSRLPLGSVKAQGWLAHQLKLMLGGLTGRLTEVSPFLASDNGWLGGNAEGWEEQPYWLRGYYSLACVMEDQDAINQAKRWIEAVIASQDYDGYFGPPALKCVNGENGQSVCDLWPHMVMLDALTRHEEVTGDPRILPLMVRFFEFCRDLPDEQFIPSIPTAFGNWKVNVQKIRAGDMLPHIYRTYNRTGYSWLLALATRFFQRIAQPKDEWLRHHGINFIHQFHYPGLYFMQSGKQWYLDQCEYWYAQHLGTWGQHPRGIYGADESIRPGAVDPRQGFETCGFGEFCKSFYLLGQLTGCTRYADRAEDLLFNHFPASMTEDLKAVHYITASNQPQLDNSEEHEYSNKYRQTSYSAFEIYRCCQHNVAMTWPWFVENLWQASADGGLIAWMYAGSTVTAQVGGGETVTIEETTDYPFTDKIAFRIRTVTPSAFPLYLRIPRWCMEMKVNINGKAAACRIEPGKYIRIARTWYEGDTVDIDLSISGVSLTTWPRTGSVTVDRGPLSYSVRIRERHECCGGTTNWPEREIFPASPWNYGLVIDPAGTSTGFSVRKQDMGAQPWSLDGTPIEIFALAKRIPGWKLIHETADVLRVSPIFSDQPEEHISLVPMGCARLRMSCLPVVSDEPMARSWIDAPQAVCPETDP